ncbi:MAG: hypothetical protein M3Q49_07325 [Actinomycetota bacterium]|nr:hypothetical protein [Actinomycetota bacterium]
MGSIENRLRRLEGDYATPCPGCGYDGDLSNVEYEVVWDDLNVDPDDLESPEACPECGRQLEIIVTWGDLDDKEGEAWSGG